MAPSKILLEEFKFRRILVNNIYSITANISTYTTLSTTTTVSTTATTTASTTTPTATPTASTITLVNTTDIQSTTADNSHNIANVVVGTMVAILLLVLLILYKNRKARANELKMETKEGIFNNMTPLPLSIGLLFQ